jgi:hypothetical protein
MKWQKTANRRWEAVGECGKFIIEQSGRLFWARYCSNHKTFKMPPRLKLSEAKAICEDNSYWEDELNAE